MGDTLSLFARFPTLRQRLDGLGYALPLRHDPAWPGTIVDANDEPLLVIDYERERSDEDVAILAELVCMAINVNHHMRADRP